MLLATLLVGLVQAQEVRPSGSRLPETIGVASFNVWQAHRYGWGDTGWDGDTSRGQRVADVIAKSGADVVGLQEYGVRPDPGGPPPPWGRGPLASMVSARSFETWRWVPTAAGGILTRLEVLEVDESGLAVRLKTAGGREIWVVNVHIGLQTPWSRFYVPYAAAEGEVSAEELVRRARMNWDLPETADPSLKTTTQGPELFAVLDRLRRGREPIFLTGDFNEPSHLDWTPEAVEAGLVPVAVQLPFSRELEKRGFRDALHLDRQFDRQSVVQRWAHTWTPGAHEEGRTADDDRIDFVLHRGEGVRVLDVETLGEPGGKGVDRSFGKWPSDHRAVVARYLLEPLAVGGQGATVAERLASTPRRGSVRVLVWNIERGANPYEAGAEKALAVIRAVDADVCLLQESYDIEDDRPTLGRWMASQLGWSVHQGNSPHLAVLTRWDIAESFVHAPWHGVGARIVDPTGNTLHVWSTWIDYRAYTPYALRDDPDASDEDLLRNETERSGRMKQAQALLEDLKALGHLDGGVPLLVGGDWNCPSHLDWTPLTARVFRFRRALDLPVSRAMSRHGFDDLFRVLHPDPLRRPGITWSPLHTGTADKAETADRIDRLYGRRGASGNRSGLVPVAAWTLPLIPEPTTVPRSARQFPSDHGAVVIDLKWGLEPR